jgi:hypothetical protein
VLDEAEDCRVAILDANTVRGPEKQTLDAFHADLDHRFTTLCLAHKAAGLSLDDFRGFTSWAPTFRAVLRDYAAFLGLATAGMRRSSLHGAQPRYAGLYSGLNDFYKGAVQFDKVIAKTIRTGRGSMSTIHGNEPYGAEAPDQAASTWKILGYRLAGAKPARVLELYLHSTGQCLGVAAGCAASVEPVLRMIEVSRRAGRWCHEERRDGQVVDHETSPDRGEWLAGLLALPEVTTVYNPLWWDRAGVKPILRDGLASSLCDAWAEAGERLAVAPVDRTLKPHQWRHTAPKHLEQDWGLPAKTSYEICHMAEATGKTVYDNATQEEQLKQRASMAPLGVVKDLESELETFRLEKAALRRKVDLLEHDREYHRVLAGGDLPKAPSMPVPSDPAPRRGRPRRVPTGAAIAA